MSPIRPLDLRTLPLLAALAGVGAPGLAAGSDGPSGPAVPAPPAQPAQPRRERSLVLMVPDLADDDLDERVLDVIDAHREDGSRVDVVRYDPEGFPASEVVAVSRRRAGEFMARGVLWVDLGNPDQLAVYFYEVDTERFLGRQIPSSRDAQAVAIETLANIAASIVAESAAGPMEGLDEVDPKSLQEQKPAEPPPEPKAPAPPPPPVPSTTTAAPPPRWPRLWLGVAYAGASFSSAVLLQHGLALSAAWGPAPGAFVGLRYDLVLPSRVEDDAVVFELRRHPVSLEGGYRLAFGRRRRGDFEVSGRLAIDPIVRRADADASDGPVTPDEVRVFSSVGLGLGLGFAPIRQVRLGLRLGPEIVLSRARYEIAGPGSGTSVDPHPVRGFLEAGAQFGLLWRSRAPRRASEEN